MNRMKRRTFDASFKREAVRLSEIGDKGVAQLEVELGLSRGQLSHWRRQYLERGAAAFEAPPRSAEARELASLRAEVARLREERAILKKVLAMYSTEERGATGSSRRTGRSSA